MTFVRGPLNKETLGVGLKEAMKQEVIKEGFYAPRPDMDFTDIELLRYVSSAGKEEWFDFLIANGDFFGKKGNIRREFSGQFNESLTFAVSHNHVGIARKLFAMDARISYYLNDSLYLAIMRGQHELTELLFENGANIRYKYKLDACIYKADERMKKIIEKGMIDTIRRRFNG